VPGPTSSTFRIVAYNAEWLFDGLHDPHDCPRSGPTAAQEHLEAVADTLRAFEADYISLAEVEDDSMLDRLNELLGGAYYPIFYPGKDSATRQNVAALSAVAPTQSPSRTPERTVYPVPGSLLACGSGSQGVSKNYVVGLDLAGTAVTIVGVHFLAFPKWCEQAVQREAQATIIADTARAALEAGREVIVLGDLNDFDGAALDAAGNKPISRVLAILKNLDPATEGDELVNVCATLPQEDRYTDWYDRDSDHIDDGTREHSQIDFILVSRGLAERIAFVTIAHTTPAGAVSDHWPIVLDLSIPSEVASATP
jgi:endonuclease/exonuclease/phosphatase family metal-dependent hydrolase